MSVLGLESSTSKIYDAVECCCARLNNGSVGSLFSVFSARVMNNVRGKKGGTEERTSTRRRYVAYRPNCVQGEDRVKTEKSPRPEVDSVYRRESSLLRRLYGEDAARDGSTSQEGGTSPRGKDGGGKLQS